jgi:hypothetical protein
MSDRSAAAMRDVEPPLHGDLRSPWSVPRVHRAFPQGAGAEPECVAGQVENFWASEQVCVVKLVGREAVMDKLVYTATNPVQDHLVDRVPPRPPNLT